MGIRMAHAYVAECSQNLVSLLALSDFSGVIVIFPRYIGVCYPSSAPGSPNRGGYKIRNISLSGCVSV